MSGAQGGPISIWQVGCIETVEVERSVEKLAGMNEIDVRGGGKRSQVSEFDADAAFPLLSRCSRASDDKDIRLVKQLAPAPSAQSEPPHAVF